MKNCKVISVTVSFLVPIMLLSSCQWMKGCGSDTEIDEEVVVERFDRLESRYIQTGDYVALQEMNTEYPAQTRLLFERILNLGNVTDASVKYKFRALFQDSIAQIILLEVDREFTSMADIDRQLAKAIERFRKFLPDVEPPKFYAQIGTLNQSIVVHDNLVGISLDKYLGIDNALYANYFTGEQRQSMTRAFIVPDGLSFYLLSQFPLSDVNAPKAEQDFHMGKIMWFVNKCMSSRFFNTTDVARIDTYMRQHRGLTAKQLLSDVTPTDVQ